MLSSMLKTGGEARIPAAEELNLAWLGTWLGGFTFLAKSGWVGGAEEPATLWFGFPIMFMGRF